MLSFVEYINDWSCLWLALILGIICFRFYMIMYFLFSLPSFLMTLSMSWTESPKNLSRSVDVTHRWTPAWLLSTPTSYKSTLAPVFSLFHGFCCFFLRQIYFSIASLSILYTTATVYYCNVMAGTVFKDCSVSLLNCIVLYHYPYCIL